MTTQCIDPVCSLCRQCNANQLIYHRFDTVVVSADIACVYTTCGMVLLCESD